MAEEENSPVNAGQSMPSEPATPVNEVGTSVEAKPTDAQAQPIDDGRAETAHMGRIEPLGEGEPLVTSNASASPVEQVTTHAGKDILVKARATIQNRKRIKLEKILEHLNIKNHITNDEVERLLYVSDATATRYLSQLESEGKIRQIGKTGKAVTYTKP